MLNITPGLSIPLSEIHFSAIRSSGPGGQNVNKVASAIHLRFDVPASSLSCARKAQILRFRDGHITSEGVIIIKAQSYRTQKQNRDDALIRLAALLRAALHRPKARRATRPTRASKERRLKAKTQRGQRKSARGKVRDFD